MKMKQKILIGVVSTVAVAVSKAKYHDMSKFNVTYIANTILMH